MKTHQSHRLSCGLVIAAALVAGSGSVSRASADFNELLTLVPEDANALFMINVTGLLGTPMAERLHWAAQIQLQASDKAIVLPPAAEEFVMSARLGDVDEEPLWQSVLVTKPQIPSIQAVAEREGGRTDMIEGYEAVLSPRDMYFIRFSDRVGGALHPADRQSTVRWLRRTRDRATPQYSSFLTGAVDAADLSESQMLLAMDLDGMVSAADIRPDLETLESLKDSVVNRDDLADLIGSIQGVSLAIAVDEGAHGTLTVQFGQDASFISDVAKGLVIEVLGRIGASLIELPEWDATVSGDRIIMTGVLTTSGLRRISSLLDAPVPSVHKAGSAAAEASGEPKSMAEASQQYFKAIRAYVDDVNKAQNAERTSDVAMWMTRYADKIEQLSILGVDPDLADFGAFVSQQLREAGARAADVNLRSGERMAAHRNFYDTSDTGGARQKTVATRYSNSNHYRNYSGRGNYRRGGWGGSRSSRSSGYDVHQVEAATERYRSKYQEGKRRQIAQEERAKGRRDTLQIINEINGEIAKMRRVMTEKYNVEF